MKYNIVFKFLAVFLCAVMLLGAVGSAAGILAITEMGLYTRSFEEAYEEYLEDQSTGFAHNAAVRYASMALGGCTAPMMDDFYGTYWYNGYFDFSKVSYTLKDSQGNVLQTQEMDSEYRPEYRFSVPAVGEYIQVVSAMPLEEYRLSQESAENREALNVSIVPDTDVEISAVYIAYSDGTADHFEMDSPLGYLQYNGSQELVFIPYDVFEPQGLREGRTPVHIILVNSEGSVVYEADCATGVLRGGSLDEGSYQLRLPVSETPVNPVGITYSSGDYTVYDAVPNQGTTVAKIKVTYGDVQNGDIASEGMASPDLIGTIFHDHQGNAEFHSKEAMQLDMPVGANITHIIFTDAQENVVYEASCPGGVGSISYDENGYLIFKAEYPEAIARTVQPEATAPEIEAAEEGTSATTLEIVNIRIAPHESATVVGYLEAGTEVRILRQETVDNVLWAQTGEGWIRLAYLALTPAEELPDAATQETTVEATASAEDAVPQETVIVDPTGEAADEMAEVPVTQPEMTEAVTEAAEPAPAAETVPAEELETFEYYDYEQKQHMVVQYVRRQMPEYTMVVEIAPGASNYEYEWVLMEIAYNFRDNLLPGLGICVLLFAVFAVYLCCAAGKKPGSREIRPGGMNRIPLDLYAVAAVGGVCVCFVAGMEGMTYLMRSSVKIGLFFALAAAFLASLLAVGFGFACAAQFKTPGGYWWKNSACVRSLKLTVICGKPLLKCFEWLDEKWGAKLFPGLIKLLRNLWKITEVALKQIWKWIQAAVRMLEKSTDYAGRMFIRFFGLLPVTWQFLATGFVLVFLLYVVLRSYKVGWILVGFGIFFAVILYAASAFGILLDSAKKMSKGDLDSKVNDKMLIGSFKDFAQELNELADVAVVAAQKQLKSERMKTELITNVSHDIKTPLTSIINYVDLMEKPHTPEEQEVYLEVLSRQSQRLKKLVDDLMEMSKASTGNLAVEITRVDAAEAVNQALGEFADKLERAQLTPVFRQPEGPVEMLADGRLVWRVMSNLLGNAVKYALPGTRLYLDLTEVDGKVIISLKNISREELNVNADELLERFVRGDASRNTEGSGLGLNIAQSLMELQKGQLQLLVDGDLFKVTLIFPGA